MPLKKKLVDGNLFDTDDSRLGNKFDDPVNHQKRIAVRQKLLNFANVKSYHDWSNN